MLAVVILCSSLLPSEAAVPAEAPEPVLKAATVYNVAHFVDWPKTRFAGRNSPVLIGVLGNDSVADGLEEIARSGQKIGSRNFDVLRLKPEDDFRRCHVLVIGGNREFDPLLNPAEVGNVLTIGEQPLFAERGGMVNMVVVDKRVRFDINKGATDKAGLEVSSKLLNLARKVIKTQSGKKKR